MASIHLLNSSSIRESEIEAIKKNLQEVFTFPVSVSKRIFDLRQLYDVARRQYSSTVLLSLLHSESFAPEAKLIALLDVDLYIPILTFVFGEAEFNGLASVVSTYRLRNEFYGLQEDPVILRARIEKELIHELGHTFGLYHCRQFECVMRSSTYVEEIDVKRKTFCEECQKKLHSAIG